MFDPKCSLVLIGRFVTDYLQKTDSTLMVEINLMFSLVMEKLSL